MYLFQGTERSSGQDAGYREGDAGMGGAATMGGLCRQGVQEGPGQHCLLTLCE